MRPLAAPPALALALALTPALAVAQSSLLVSIDAATGRDLEATRQTAIATAHLDRCTTSEPLGRIGAEGGVELAIARNGHIVRVTLSGDDDDETAFRRCVRRALGRIVFARARTASTVTLHLVDLGAVLAGADPSDPPPRPDCTADADCTLVCPAPPACCVPMCGCDHAEPTSRAEGARASCGGLRTSAGDRACGWEPAECPGERYLARCELGQCVARTPSGAAPPAPPAPPALRGSVVLSAVPETAPDHALLTRTLATRRAQLVRCYEMALRANPALTGTIRLRVVVSEAGRLAATTIEAPFDAATAACMIDAISRWRIAVPADDAADDAFDLSIQLEPLR